jgi:hypothetical protein
MQGCVAIDDPHGLWIANELNEELALFVVVNS